MDNSGVQKTIPANIEEHHLWNDEAPWHENVARIMHDFVSDNSPQGYDNGGAIQKTFESENVPSAIVSPKPGVTYGQIAGKTVNQQRIEDLSKNAMNILNGTPVRQWAERHFGIKDYNITPVLGTWQNEPEPSFSITGKNLNKAKAQRFASALGMGMWQDAAVHSFHHPQEDLDNGTPTVLLGHGGVLSPKERQKILSAAAEHKRDLTFTKDGKAAKFSFFGDPEEHEQFVDDIDNIKKKSGMPEALMVRTAGDLTDAKDYFKKIVGTARQRKGLEGSSGQSSDLFRGLVDHVLTPFTREAEKQGYRFSLERFANHHALTDAERQYLYDKATPHERKPPSGVGFGTPTVKDPVGYEYPGIYGDPRALVAEAASRVAPESPNLKKLFNVTRADLYEMGKNRVGNMEPTLATSEVPRGSLATEGIMTPKNEQRLIDILTEAGNHQGLRHGMDAWYVMDPLYQHMVDKFGHEGAVKRYKVLNTLTGMASPGSEVPTEINRGMAAYYLHHQNRFEDFMRHAGKAENKRGSDFPADIRDVMGHPYHSTSQAGPMQRYLQSGSIEMGTPKVPTYIPASGVPQTGFQTTLPVPDAHFTRIIGMADTRKNMEPGASMKMPEYQQIAPWWRNKIARQVGLQSVPAQARIWGAGSGATGVSSPIGAPKLEMFADYIASRARRHGISHEEALDKILGGKLYNSGGRVGYADGSTVDDTDPDSPENRLKKLTGDTSGLTGTSGGITPGFTKSTTTPDDATQQQNTPGVFGGIFGGTSPQTTATKSDDTVPYSNTNYQPGAVQAYPLADVVSVPASALTPVTQTAAVTPEATRGATVAATPSATTPATPTNTANMFTESGKFTGKYDEPVPGALLPGIAERNAANLATYGDITNALAASQSVNQSMPGAVSGQNLVGTFDPLASQDVLGDTTHGVFGLSGPMGISNAIQQTQEQLPDDDEESPEAPAPAPETPENESPEGDDDGGGDNEGGGDGDGERRGGFIRPRHHMPHYAYGGFTNDALLRYALHIAHQFGPDAAQRAVQIALQQAGRR